MATKPKNPYLVVIPYLPIACQGCELLFAIEGWRRHFKEPFHIVVIGEGVHGLDAEDLTCINSPRVPERPGQYRQHLDYVNCLRQVREMFPKTRGFIMVADDCYAVNDFTIKDVRALKVLAPDIDYNPETPNAWRRDALKTKQALLNAGLPTRNFTTHLPQWFEWGKWAALVEQYQMDRESYVIEDLYYNTYHPDEEAVPIADANQPYKFGVYTTRPDENEIRQALADKIWITNSPDGWVPALFNTLQGYYKLKR